MDMTALERTAAACAADLRNGLSEWTYQSTRREIRLTAIANLSHAVAEDLTGLDRQRHKAIGLASSKDVTPEDRELANTYRDLQTHAANQFNGLDYLALLEQCEIKAGERAAAA